MARLKATQLAALRDARGSVYIEFLIAFFPLFLLFLGICQLCLMTAAKAIVHHAAFAGVRSAIVVLEDDPQRFAKAPRGQLIGNGAKKIRGLEAVLAKLGVSQVAIERAKNTYSPALVDKILSQSGARMVPIRTAAMLPLLSIAPNEGSLHQNGESLGSALMSASDRQLGFAAEYTKSATLVSIHESPQSEALLGSVGPKSSVTLRVTYLFHCAVPLVRVLMCHTPSAIANEGTLALGVAYKMAGIAGPDARFRRLTATATLPNQGADYLSGDGE